MWMLRTWVLYEMTMDNKMQCWWFVQHISHNEQKPCLDHLLMCDDKWFMHCKTKYNYQYMEDQHHIR